MDIICKHTTEMHLQTSTGLILNKERHIFVLILVEQKKKPLETMVLLCPSV